ncbi:MAG: DUF2790 domain-containing protein [Janthinobacterium lividum]
MNLSFKTLALGLALVASSSVFAATAAQTKPVMDKDAAFVHLDVARVISDNTTGSACGIDKAKMLYLNHEGVEHELDYRVQGECPQQN